MWLADNKNVCKCLQSQLTRGDTDSQNIIDKVAMKSNWRIKSNGQKYILFYNIFLFFVYFFSTPYNLTPQLNWGPTRIGTYI